MSSAERLSMRPWQFAIDVGGTFTDCVAIRPDGTIRTFKTLSSGRTKGRIELVESATRFLDPARRTDPPGFWIGARLWLEGAGPSEGVVVADSLSDGTILFQEDQDVRLVDGSRYEIATGEEAPVLGIRHLLGLRPGDPFPQCDVKLGTTRGTNALLERKGARVGLVTTRGFGDLLRIGDQARPKLFELAIRKPEPLFASVLEVDERLAADGGVLMAPVPAAIREGLVLLREQGMESLAVVLLHSYRNPDHERIVAQAAEGLGFREVVLSSDVSPTIKVVPRGESTVVDAYLNPVLRAYVAQIAKQLNPGPEHPAALSDERSGGTLESSFVAYLASRGLRLTRERQVILNTIERLARPLEAEELVAELAVLPDGRRVSRATVYRVLNLLVEGGFYRLATSSLHCDRFERSPSPPATGPRTSLKIMTSAGGLVAAAGFTGRDSILSGPAGGVVGSSRTASRAGFSRSIGFDMGGTSTDVSRFDGRFELEYESRKAGVRIASPMLAIETVAAGGGSLCRFDGVKLVVGPESAGSDPGPACYGRGGPLTITDCNLALGRLVEEQFPFRLDRSAVGERLVELSRVVGEATGRALSPEGLAAGFLEIANAHMARAIRRISVSRGYDPADYALSVFGGAGAQHACPLAAQLGMRAIVVHPFAGALSAYGIACADTVHHAAASLLRPLSSIDAEMLEETFRTLEQEAEAGLATDGLGGTVRFQRTLDLRYSGVEASLSIAAPGGKDLAEAYAAAHEREFGYRRPDRGVEVVAARVEARLESPDPPAPEVPTRWVASAETSRLYIDGEWISCPRYVRSRSGGVTSVAGPALLSESMTTIVLDRGFQAEIDAEGAVVVRRVTETGTGPVTTEETAADPVQLEIFNNLFASIAEQMGETLRRTSISTNVKERLDYSCAVFDAAGELIVNAPHIPVHLGAMAETVRHVLADNPDLGPGDVVLTNDPFRGGSHLPDLTVVTPVFNRAGENLLFVVASRAHHAEIGGIVPGSMPPFSKSLAEEGVLIRNFRIVRRGEFRERALRHLLGDSSLVEADKQSGDIAGIVPPRYPSRRPDDNVADLTAQIAANQTGVNLLRQLVAEQSLSRVQRYMRFIREAAAIKVCRALAAMPDSEYRCVDHLDDGSPVAVTITVSGESAVVDFAGTGTVLPSNLNANRAIVTAAVLYVFRTLINEDIPLNGGVLEPVEIRIPESLLSPPAYDDPARCAAIVGGNVETSQRVVDVLLRALGLAACSQGTMNNLTFGDATFGYYETICGGSGATPEAPGADAVHTHMTNTRMTDVELFEQRYPVRIRRFEIRRGSGGAGRHPGGAGILRELEFLQPMTVSILSQRRGPYPPAGLSGGSAGDLGRNAIHRQTGEVSDLGGAAQVLVNSGDRVVIETPGGGGWGVPSAEGV